MPQKCHKFLPKISFRAYLFVIQVTRITCKGQPQECHKFIFSKNYLLKKIVKKNKKNLGYDLQVPNYPRSVPIGVLQAGLLF